MSRCWRERSFELRTAFNAGKRTLSIRYPTVSGLRYRVQGGSSLGSLAPLGDWIAGFGIEQEFVATPAVTGGANNFFLRLEVAPK